MRKGIKPDALRRSVLDALAARAEATSVITAAPSTPVAGDSPIVRRAEREISDKDGRIYFGGKPYYNNNSRRESRELVFRGMLKELCSAGGIPIIFGEDSFRIENIEIVNLNRCMFGRDWGKVVTCVCHGDMNGNNVMYTGDRTEVAFIDFQNTGFHYLFKDFVSFESSVRLELPGEDVGWSEAEFLRVLQNENQLINATWDRLPDDESYISQITKIRDAAHQNFPDEKFETYVLANTVHSLWLLEKSAKWAKYKQRRLLAAILAGAQHLQTA